MSKQNYSWAEWLITFVGGYPGRWCSPSWPHQDDKDKSRELMSLELSPKMASQGSVHHFLYHCDFWSHLQVVWPIK
jgi:hypothetical protein